MRTHDNHRRARSLERALAGGAVALVAALALLSSSGCVQSSVITSDPEGAEVWVQGEYLGMTPATYRSRSGLPQRFSIRLEKPGYEPVRAAGIEKLYMADISLLALLPGIVPYFFTARLEEGYEFKLRPVPGTIIPTGPRDSPPSPRTDRPAAPAAAAAAAPAREPETSILPAGVRSLFSGGRSGEK